MKYIVILFLLLATPCWAVTMPTSRGDIEVKKGDTLKTGSMAIGTVDGLEDVTFIEWNFRRDHMNTTVFTNSKNLTFIKCNLVNVVIPKDATLIKSLAMQKRDYELLGRQYTEITVKGKVKTFETVTTTKDLLKDDLTGMTVSDIEKLKTKLEDGGFVTEEVEESLNLISVEDVQ